MALDALSALLDGECSDQELDRVLEELERSPELARQWSRMCLSRDAREGVRVTPPAACICSEVMGRLDATPGAVDDPARIVDLASRRTRRAAATASAEQRRRSGYPWRPLVGFAAAASMGAAAVFFLQPQQDADPSRPVGIPAAGTLAHWNSATPAGVEARPVALSQDDAHAEMLREYLIDHSSVAAGEGLGSTLRYARFAAHTADYRPEPAARP